MLALHRREKECITIHKTDAPLEDAIKIQVLSIGPKRIHLGITAPSNYRIWRDELLDENGKLLPKKGRK